MAIETRKTYCRFCLGCCAMDVDVEDGVPVALRGDPDNPLSGGYTCLRAIAPSLCMIVLGYRLQAGPVFTYTIPGMKWTCW